MFKKTVVMGLLFFPVTLFAHFADPESGAQLAVTAWIGVYLFVVAHHVLTTIIRNTAEHRARLNKEDPGAGNVYLFQIAVPMGLLVSMVLMFWPGEDVLGTRQVVGLLMFVGLSIAFVGHMLLRKR